MAELMQHPIEHELQTDPDIVTDCLREHYDARNRDVDIFTDTLERRNYLKFLAGVVLHDTSEKTTDAAARAFDFATNVSALCGLDGHQIYAGDDIPKNVGTDAEPMEQLRSIATTIARDSHECVAANPRLQQLICSFKDTISPSQQHSNENLATLVSVMAAHIYRGNQRASIQQQINELERICNQPTTDN